MSAFEHNGHTIPLPVYWPGDQVEVRVWGYDQWEVATVLDAQLLIREGLVDYLIEVPGRGQYTCQAEILRPLVKGEQP